MVLKKEGKRMENVVELRKFGIAYGIYLPIPARLALDVREGDYLSVKVEGDKGILTKGGKHE